MTSRQTPPTRVLCVDDNSDMADMMRMMIDAEPMMQCVGCLSSADRLIETVRNLKPQPDVVLLDATMPGKDALEELRKMAVELPAVRTIVYSGHDDPEIVGRAYRAGAWACVSKRDEPDTVLRAVREVAAGRTWRAHPSARTLG
jgi:DNA-binding NarL/FixJ family response regulator